MANRNIGSQASIRQLRISELLRRNLATTLRIVLRLTPSESALLAVSRVIITADFKMAKVYLSIVMDDKDSCEKILQQVIDKTSDIRYALSKNIELKSVPELRFYCEKLDLLNIIDKEHKHNINHEDLT